MKITYDPEVDILVIHLVEDRKEFKARLSHDVQLLKDRRDVRAAIAKDGGILSIDIEDASRYYSEGELSRYPATYDAPISLADAARLEGVSPETLKKAIQRGRLEGKKIGRNWTTTIDALTRYINSRVHEGPGSAGSSDRAAV